ncbi:MAG: hypothetical protein EXS63_00185 [Candidatus Omnitrophica bacterium]|nr:hypothetical protein [Candidatus Omnitrophota bacterium]
MRVFYAGDSPADGPARYLLGILKHLKAEVTHLPPGNQLTPDLLRSDFDLYIFSDFSYRDFLKPSEQILIKKVAQGAGFLMVGGWGSFAGPFGGWHNSAIESLLPVTCLNRDDRQNFPGGALVLPATSHKILKGISFAKPAAICGVNQVRLKSHAQVLLNAKAINYRNGNVFLNSAVTPLLAVGGTFHPRIAAFMTDFAPHWSAGFIDWGTRVKRIKIQEKIEIQVGNLYVQFISQLLSWLAKP